MSYQIARTNLRMIERELHQISAVAHPNTAANDPRWRVNYSIHYCLVGLRMALNEILNSLEQTGPRA